MPHDPVPHAGPYQPVIPRGHLLATQVVAEVLHGIDLTEQLCQITAWNRAVYARPWTFYDPEKATEPDDDPPLPLED